MLTMLALLGCSGGSLSLGELETEPDDTGSEDCEELRDFYIDADGDGYGGELQEQACEAGDGLVVVGGDCDDGDPATYPEAEEDCEEPVDRNCDGSIGYADQDGDGAAACIDCDDTDPARFPGAEEVCDELDNDCDGQVDVGAVDAVAGYVDADGDGYGAGEELEICDGLEGYSEIWGDCDDGDPAIHPWAEETCDGADTDCDGVIAELRVPEDYATISEALEASSSAGWVCVDDGTYGEELSMPAWSVVVESRNGSSSVTVEASSGRVVTFGEPVEGQELRGFTLQGGQADQGAGVYVGAGAAPWLEDLVVTGNAGCAGAGVYVDGGSPVLVDVELEANTAEACSTAYGVLAVEGAGDVGAEDLRIVDNTCEGEVVAGCAAWFGAESSGDLVRWWVGGNSATAEASAPGMVTFYTDATVTAENLAVVGNELDAGDGAAFGMVYSSGDVSLSNASIVGNTVDGGTVYGVGLLAWYYGTSLELVNVDVSYNTASSAPEGVGSVCAEYDPTGHPVTVSYGNAYGNTGDPWTGSSRTGSDGNVAQAPAYVDITGADPNAWDLALTSSSGLVNAGDPALTDSDGTRSDIGAYGGPEAW